MEGNTKQKQLNVTQFILSISIALFVFLWSLDLMTSTFHVIGNETVIKVLSITSNPFISLFIGLFITAVIQSSSTSTSLIVAVVASGGMTLENAVPMIMGANIGTTLTSTIVSLSYITDNKEFKNAIATGVMHDFFNIMTVIILFPLEYYYHLLSKLSISVASIFNLSSLPTKTGQDSSDGLFDIMNGFLTDSINNKVVLVLLSCIALFASIKIISKIISKRMIGASDEKFQEVFFKNTLNSFGLGTMLTAGIQSSSITTSIIVPLGATGKIHLGKIFPYIVGANIGTTITALIAAFNKSEAAVSIALVHFLFNLIGTLIFLFIPYLKRLPVQYARKFGMMTMQYKVIGFFYILFVFFILPLALIFLNKL
ncbi:solute carrier family 34 (sodium-dependent phosphate cotransporter) [Reichenbachiella faecimaris]|uniref:Solute carrier family 34 (Sodium-dependent phosphate cotransporter) n=1 Tax=Reichenbachiella faecimaris TaxID=692418 RepID=A0A1W2GPW5_REIFA|nr:Na/Pi symporter [Reichenbachiella faecimaris]SMD38614.1 solute carrier family 34 (sodium-dependent phosphate cotransporter) [Reichenbachiella faecimaris]